MLLALAATAHHAVAAPGAALPDLIIGHGVLGRLLARLVVAQGGAPVVWERNAGRAEGAIGYTVLDPEADARRDYRCICDVSGDSAILDTLIARLAPGGEIVLAGFYAERLGFAFPPAFMREARIRIAARMARAGPAGARNNWWRPGGCRSTASSPIAGTRPRRRPPTGRPSATPAASKWFWIGGG